MDKISLNEKFISVITVVLNAEKYIEKTIKSVIKHRNEDCEYIMIDGGSRDSTLSIINKYAYSIDIFISEPDYGIYDAMNKGISLASGKWIYFLNAGDELFVDLVKIKYYLSDDMTIYYGDALWPFYDKIYDGRFTPVKILFKNICHQTIFYPQKLFFKYLFNIKYKVLADYALNLISYSDNKFKFEYIPYIIARCEDETGFSKNNEDKIFEKDKGSIIRKHFPVCLVFIYYLRKLIIDISNLFGIKKKLITLLEIFGLKKYFVY